MKKSSTTSKKSNQNKTSDGTIRFQPGEKILCYQGQHIYEAKCLNLRKSEENPKNIEYLVHYRGWKSKYDEWVTPERMLKYTAENLNLQQKLRAPRNRDKRRKLKKQFQEQSSKKEKLKKSESFDSASSTSVTNHRHRHHHHHLNVSDIKNIEVPPLVERPEEFLAKKEIKIRIPEDLKTLLTDDWELITNQKKLVHLPFHLNIDKILNDYFFHKSQVSKLPCNHTMNGYVEFLSGIRKYFNYYLDKCLLYPSEREQMEYLKENYQEFTANTAGEISSGSRRLMKKLNKTNGGSKTGKPPPLPSPSSSVLMTENSQSETSDSCASNNNEISSNLNFSNTNNNDPDVVDFTKLYGAVHLLRLFTKLPEFLFYSDLDTERLATLNSYISDFLRYLSKNFWIFSSESDTSYVDANLFSKM